MSVVGSVLKYIVGSIISSITYYAVNNAWSRLTNIMRNELMPLDPDDGVAVENTEDNREKLIQRVLECMSDDDIREMAADCLDAEYDRDENQFQEDWKTYIEDYEE